jgi:hypothetical protein
MSLTWADLLIEDITPEQFRRWMGEWVGFIEGEVAPAFLNKFGSRFLRRREGPVEMLDVLAGAVEPVPDSYDEFIARVNERGWQEQYLLSELVYELHEHGKVPGPGQCYALAPHPALGGPNPMLGQAVDPASVLVMDVGVWQRLCAQFLRGGG